PLDGQLSQSFALLDPILVVQPLGLARRSSKKRILLDHLAVADVIAREVNESMVAVTVVHVCTSSDSLERFFVSEPLTETIHNQTVAHQRFVMGPSKTRLAGNLNRR